MLCRKSPICLSRHPLNSVSHASIDPATRAARGLPEDLIRLCVGIEDASDLIEDLEYALLEAGAITFSTNENKMVRSSPAIDAALRDAMQKLATDAEPSTTEWFVSAPGKIILFGEHAVVHGVVWSLLVVTVCTNYLDRLPLQHLWIYGAMVSAVCGTMAKYLYISTI